MAVSRTEAMCSAHWSALSPWFSGCIICLENLGPYLLGPNHCSSLNAYYLIDGHFSVPDASAPQHDGCTRQQHDGPGTHSEPVSATESVPIIQWGHECEQCGHGAASCPDRRVTGMFTMGTLAADIHISPASLQCEPILFHGNSNSRILVFMY